jgi:hypothetical protein
MFKSILIKTALLSMMIGSLSASATTTIDLFSDDQAYQSITGGVISSYANGPDVIGGERDIIITSGSNVTASTFVTGNELRIGSSSGTGGTLTDNTFSVEVQWDGLDGGSSAVDLTPGISPAVDFSTLNGFSATINKSDGSGSFAIDLYDGTGLAAAVTLFFNSVASGSPKTFSIPFANFMPATIDLTTIKAIVLKMTAIGDVDINVASVMAVPAPSSLAVLGLGLLAFAGFARRKA